jgi:hypothetical protein
MNSQKSKTTVGSKPQHVPSHALIVLMSSLMLTSCLSPTDMNFLEQLFDGVDEPGDPGDPPLLGPNCYNQRITQPEAEVTRKLDILFVTDTSGSLDEERGEIADGIESFVGALPSEVDFRIGVMLGHAVSGWSGKLYKKGSEPHVLNSETQTLAQIQTQLRSKLVNPATEGYSDGGEVGLYSLQKSLSGAPLTQMMNQGFMRSDAALAVIFIADENDICTPGQVPDPDGLEGSAYQNYCVNPAVTPQGVLDKLRDVKGMNPLVVAGIIYNNAATIPLYGENEIGLGYKQIIQLANGIAVDLADGDYDASLAQIGTLTSIHLTLIVDVLLEHSPVNASTIEVKVDGQEEPHQYNATSNVVHLLEPGGSESVVDITYCLEEDPPNGGGCTNPNGCGGGGIGV